MVAGPALTPALFDTNILVSALLHADGRASAILRASQSHGPAISIITWMEVMVGASPAREEATKRFLSRFQAIDLSPEIAERAVSVRRSMRLKLPDALVYASALATGRELHTAGRGDFPPGTPGVVLVALTN